MKMVLQKFIAQAGFCSRRQATELIKNGRVKVNGRIAELGARVDAGDRVEIGKQRLRLAENKIYIKLNKPVGYTCTNRKFKEEKNIFDLLPTKSPALPLHIAGRLDKNSRGLILLTNDGELTEKLTHPKHRHEKKYIVNTEYQKNNVKNILQAFALGIDISEDNGAARVKKAKYLGSGKFEIILTEGKKRQIRRMFRTMRCTVVDLVRVEIAGLKLGGLKTGEWKHLSKKEIQLLKNS